MGHFLVIAISVILFGVFITSMMGRGGGDRKMRRGTLPSERPVVREKPSADEPTPADSITAGPRQQENARRKTPPA